MSQTVDGITTNYVLDSNSALTQILQDGANTYVYGLGRISQTDGAATEYFLTDGLGSVRQLVDGAGNVTLAKSYQPYGAEVSSGGSGYSSFGFTGEMTDPTRLIYLRARYYASDTGRFISRDTWGGNYNRPLSLNRWNYVEGNPINATDPSGHITEKESKRAELILEKLNNIYSIQIEKDWGYLNDLFYVDPSLRTWSDCQWVDGHWRSLRELELTLEAVKDLAKVLGPQKGLFNTSIRWQPVRLYRISSEHFTVGDDDFGGYSLNNVILPNWPFDGTDMRAKGTVVHELAHVIDYRQWWPPFKLSNGMAALTKSFKDGVYDPTGEAAPSDYAQSHPREDWAESFKYFVYPSFGTLGPIRTGYIKDVIWDLKTP